MQYEELNRLSRDEVLEGLRVANPEDLERLLISVALLEEDFEFALSVVLRCTRSEHAGVRGTAVLCLGHLARIHGTVPEDPVVEIVGAALHDESAYVRGQAENASDDIAQFVPDVGRKIRRGSTSSKK